nr:hypothetical protein [Rhodomicrobium sp. R_RK_3]
MNDGSCIRLGRSAPAVTLRLYAAISERPRTGPSQPNLGHDL